MDLSDAPNMEVIASAAEYKPSDTSLKLFTVHIVDKGKPLYDFSRE